MGEIADDMTDGTSCQLCGQYFQSPNKTELTYTHGYPVVCHVCWNDLKPKEKKDYQRALVPTF